MHSQRQPLAHHRLVPGKRLVSGPMVRGSSGSNYVLSSGACGEFSRPILCHGNKALACWPLPCPRAPSPHSVNTCRHGLRQGQRDRPDQLKRLRDITSVSLGTSSPGAVCTGGHGRAIRVVRLLCVCACEQACERMCVRVCLTRPLGPNKPVLSQSSALESGGRPTPFLC